MARNTKTTLDHLTKEQIAELDEHMERRIEVQENGCWNVAYKNEETKYVATVTKCGLDMNCKRYMYLRHINDIPPKHYVTDLCKNPKCVNPKHLFCGTKGEAHRKGGMSRRSHTFEESRPLTDEEVWFVDEMAGILSMNHLGVMFGKRTATISNITTRKAYKDIPLAHEVRQGRAKKDCPSQADEEETM